MESEHAEARSANYDHYLASKNGRAAWLHLQGRYSREDLRACDALSFGRSVAAGVSRVNNGAWRALYPDGFSATEPAAGGICGQNFPARTRIGESKDEHGDGLCSKMQYTPLDIDGSGDWDAVLVREIICTRNSDRARGEATGCVAKAK